MIKYRKQQNKRIKMKKVFAFIFALIFAVMLASCGEAATEATTEATTETTAEATTEATTAEPPVVHVHSYAECPMILPTTTS